MKKLEFLNDYCGEMVRDRELRPLWSFKGVSIFYLVSDKKSYPEVHTRGSGCTFSQVFFS